MNFGTLTIVILETNDLVARSLVFFCSCAGLKSGIQTTGNNFEDIRGEGSALLITENVVW